MIRYFALTLMSFAFGQNIYSQTTLDRFVSKADSIQKRNDSLIASGIYDTIVGNVKYKTISCYYPDMMGHEHYYGKLKFKNGNLDGEYISAKAKCEPCYLYDYRHNGAIFMEGVFYGEECAIGSTTVYFSNGNKSSTYSMVINPNYNGSGCQGLIDGKETYFDRYGDSLFSQFWNQGKFIKRIPYAVHRNGDIAFQINGKTLLINDTIKFADFEKIKLNPDTMKNPELAQGYYISFDVQPRNHYDRRKIQKLKLNLDSIREFDNKDLSLYLKKYVQLRKHGDVVVFIQHKDRNEIFESHFLTLVE